jgi:hypothetical protein
MGGRRSSTEPQGARAAAAEAMISTMPSSAGVTSIVWTLVVAVTAVFASIGSALLLRRTGKAQVRAAITRCRGESTQCLHVHRDPQGQLWRSKQTRRSRSIHFDELIHQREELRQRACWSILREIAGQCRAGRDLCSTRPWKGALESRSPAYW